MKRILSILFFFLVVIFLPSSIKAEGLKIVLKENQINELFQAIIEARGLNIGSFQKQESIIDVDKWYLNVDSSVLDIRPNNHVGIEFGVSAKMSGSAVFFSWDIEERAQITGVGMFIVEGSAYEGYKVKFQTKSIKLKLTGDVPDFIESLISTVVNGASFLIYRFPEVDLGTVNLPGTQEVLSGEFEIQTTNDALYIHFDASALQNGAINEVLNNKVYTSPIIITALNSISAKNTTIKSSAVVLFKSGKAVDFLPSFDIERGAKVDIEFTE